MPSELERLKAIPRLPGGVLTLRSGRPTYIVDSLFALRYRWQPLIGHPAVDVIAPKSVPVLQTRWLLNQTTPFVLPKQTEPNDMGMVSLRMAQSEGRLCFFVGDDYQVSLVDQTRARITLSIASPRKLTLESFEWETDLIKLLRSRREAASS